MTYSTPPGSGRRRSPYRIASWILAAAGTVLFITGLAAIAGSGDGTPGPAVTVLSPGPAVTQTVTWTVTATAAPGQVVLKHSGTGNWASAPFQVSSSSPRLMVAYSFSGNLIGGQPDNFAADISSGSDIQRFVNTIAASGSATTDVYPDVSSGDTTYHLDVMASGSWTITITEISS